MRIKVNERLSVRPITYEDTDLIVNWRNKERVMNNFLVRDEVTREKHINWMKEKVDTGVVKQFIIEENSGEETRPIGSVYIRDIDMETLTAEYGIFIGEDDCLGKGYGNDCVDWASSYAADMGIKTFVLRVLSGNIPALHSYEHAGFVKTDVIPGYIDGRDLIYMEKKL